MHYIIGTSSFTYGCLVLISHNTLRSQRHATLVVFIHGYIQTLDCLLWCLASSVVIRAVGECGEREAGGERGVADTVMGEVAGMWGVLGSKFIIFIWCWTSSNFWCTLACSYVYKWESQ